MLFNFRLRYSGYRHMAYLLSLMESSFPKSTFNLHPHPLCNRIYLPSIPPVAKLIEKRLLDLNMASEQDTTHHISQHFSDGLNSSDRELLWLFWVSLNHLPRWIIASYFKTIRPLHLIYTKEVDRQLSQGKQKPCRIQKWDGVPSPTLFNILAVSHGDYVPQNILQILWL